ncbi:MAG: glycosyltransferase family 4 protein [Parcubacteria group bacterium]|nr:glycosyltransferase family 4 protein [Parcubacteria group bacterium]
MYLIQLKSKNFPTKITVDLNDWEMAKTFQQLLPGQFTFVVNRLSKPEMFNGLNYREIKGPRRLRSLYVFFWWPLWFWRLRRQFPAEKKFWVWLNEPTLLAIVALWSKLFPCEILLEFIGSFRHSVERPLYRWAATWHPRIHTAALSEVARQLLIQFDQRYEPRSSVLRTGYSPGSLQQEFNPTAVRTEIGARPEDFLVSYVGHFETNGPKGVELMIEALTHLPDPRVKMYFVGGYPAEIQQFSALAQAKGVGGRVIFVPWQRDLKQAMAYANAADVMAIPTSQANQHNQFSFPVKIWEYLALGKPVISSDLPINREVLNEGNARFFTLGEAKHFAACVAELAANPDLSRQLGENGRRTAAGQTWPERAQKVIACIKSKSDAD